MSLTYSACKSIVSENLGGDPAVLDAGSIVNAAGRLLYNMRQWRFARAGPVGLGVTDGSDKVSLPSDFGGMVSLTGSTSTPINIIDTEHFGLLKAGAVAWPGSGYAGIITGDTSGFTPVAASLRVYPTPSADASDVFQLVYTRNWTALASDAAYAQIPDYMEPLFIEVLTETARGYDEDDTAGLTVRMNGIRSGRVYRDTLESEARRYQVRSTLSNGVGQMPVTNRWDRSQAEWPG